MEKKTKLWGIASLCLGIASILFVLAPYFGLPLAITAIVFYSIQKKHEQTGPATGGLVTGIIGIVINLIALAVVGTGLLFIGALNAATEDTTDIGVVDTESIVSNTATVDSEEAEEITCPTITKTGTYEFEWGESIEGNRNLYLYANFLKSVKFSDGWELVSLPSSNEFMPDSFLCERGDEAGESTNKLYCIPTLIYEPAIQKNTIDSDGNIITTDYQYIKSFIFDISGKDIKNANDLKTLKMEAITCSDSSW